MCTTKDLNNKCTGSVSCTVCTNCSRCGYCNNGGSCGVCGSKYKLILPQNSSFATNPLKFYDYRNNYTSTKNYKFIFSESVNMFYNRDKVIKYVPSDKHWWVIKAIGTTGGVQDWTEKAQSLINKIREDLKFYKQYREEENFINLLSHSDNMWCYDSQEQILCYNEKPDSEFDLQRPIGIWIYEYEGKAPEDFLNIGKLVFWTSNYLHLPIKMHLDHKYIGTITKNYPPDDVIWTKKEGTVFISLKKGRHIWEAELSNGSKITKEIYLEKREQQLIKID